MRTSTLLLCLAASAACTDPAGPSDPAAIDGALGPDAGPDAAPDAMPAGPAVTITSHTDRQRITGARTVTLAGTLTSEEPVTEVTVTVGSAAPVAATFDQAGFTAELTLGDADNRITVTATAGARTGQATLTLTYPFLALTSFQDATLVLGQPTFTSAAARSADPGRIRAPFGRPVEAGGVVFVPDYGGGRVLGFRGFPAADGAAADFAIGQPNLTNAQVGVSATLLEGPQTVEAHAGRLYLLEYNNSRITIFPTVPTGYGAAAGAAIGQASLTTKVRACSATGLSNPEDMIIAGGRLIVADAGNHRVLIWNTVPTTGGVAPDVVLGQADLTHCRNDDDNQDGTTDATPTARTMDYPASVWSDGTRLIVADSGNHRVLIWDRVPAASFTPPDLILGQPDASGQSRGTAADRLSYPYGLTSNGNQLFVADESNHRVLVWNQLPTANVAADVVLGQGDFTRAASNDDDQNGTADATPSRRTLREPSGAWLVRDRLFVTDQANNRVLVFGPPVCTVNAGLYEAPAGSGTCVADPCATTTCSNQRTCDRSTGAAVCTCPAGVAGDCDTCVRYVDVDAAGAATGLSWTDAYPRLQPAIDAAAAAGQACEVWVGEGVYYTYASAETDTVSVRGSVTVRGGFAGTESSAAARAGGASILDGRDGPAGTLDVRHVVSSTTTVAGTPALDRLTIREGNADGTGNDANGGGLLVGGTSRIAITDCRFEDNQASGSGGAIQSNPSAAGAVTITRTTFTGNRAGTAGGAASLAGGTVRGCDFTGNSVGTTFGQGGGALSVGGTGTITGSRFTGNRATGDAGALWVRGGSSTWTVSDSDFAGNRGNNGGAVYFDASGSTSVLRSCTLVGNLAAGVGGGLFVRDASPTLANLTLVGNLAAGGAGGGIAFSGSSSPATNLIVWDSGPASAIQPSNYVGALTYSAVEGGFTGAGNLAAAPGFVHAPAAWDRVTASSAPDVVTVTQVVRFAVGDHVELGDDGVARQITAITGDDLTVTPAATAALVGLTVQNWGASTDVDADLRLAAGSVCIDAGDGDRAPAADHDGAARVDDPAVTDTGVGAPAYTDLGAHERQP